MIKVQRFLRKNDEQGKQGTETDSHLFFQLRTFAASMAKAEDI
jgi:hypothetical protein